MPSDSLLPLLSLSVMVVWAVVESAMHAWGLRQPNNATRQKAGLAPLLIAVVGSVGYAVLDSHYLGWSHLPLASISPCIGWSAFLLLGAGVTLRLVARMTLLREFSGYVQTSREHRLITHGAYALVRHPIYLATLLIYLGAPAAFGSWGAWLMSLGVGFPSLCYRLHVEEAALDRWFGEEYRAYRAKTAAWIPGLW